MKLPRNSNLKITSRDNEHVKFARKTRDGGRNGEQIFIEGLRLAEEALRANLSISDIFFTENFAKNERHRDFLKSASRFNLIEVSDKVFDSLADTKTSQGVIVIAEKPAHDKDVIEARSSNTDSPLIILLHQINNPANLGAIMRTAEAVGTTGVITTKNSADAFSPKALRGSMGAALRLPVWTNADYVEVLSWSRARNLKSVCADIKSRKSYTEIDWTSGRLLIVGSEGHGLTIEEQSAADENLIIPMENGVESLNVAVACGVILFEAKRQRSQTMENGKRKMDN